MKLKDEDFELLKPSQYCDTPSCSHYQLGAGNIKTYCRNGSCPGKPFFLNKNMPGFHRQRQKD
ncbi:MAG: hypothetical protein K9J37_20405 [Saprospiraceae bacterium]|nr:hypothetical protein [Saprospiraceae bacterium]MCF8252289.1 hypothetical protein [Saprospiraceae bacterium]MCF8282084.1 hypothetical protein [Bacteroidales bacterium]MCF8313930.1 hypothetical protein [Saprospiraceae bacterium]MCF8442641.1 hypothetical protein [Saprospiraceae bacterium]